jgi:lysophospholipase L1-like esterase
MIDNKINRPVLLIGFTILFVIIISHFINGITIFGYTVKSVDLFSDIKPDSLISFNSNQYKEIGTPAEQNNQYSMSQKNSAGQKFDNSALAANVSFDLINRLLNNDNSNERNMELVSKASGNSNVQISGNMDQMKYIFDALKNARNGRVRIAHFGDSGVEGDAITADVRKVMQKEFGGKGVGYLSITSQDITFRITTKQSFSDNWKTVSVLTANPQNLPLGLSGFVSIPQGSSWVNYETTGWDSQLKYFNTAKLFYSNAKNSSIKYSFNNGSDQNAPLKTGDDIKELTLSAPGGSASSIKISATMADQAYFYGVSLESGNGVYVDNFPWRGNTGLGFLNIQQSSLQQFNKLENYKLIILEFGANEVSFGSQDNTWFENQMIKEINNLKKAFPQTSILLIGMGDKGIKKGTKFVTDPGVPQMLKLQQDIAAKTGIAFWSLFDAMGGPNTMDTWVKANPPLAYMDYSHPTWEGAARIGQMIANAILDAFHNYKK